MQNFSKLTGMPPDVKFVIFKFWFFFFKYSDIKKINKYSDICQTPHEILAGGTSQLQY